jgi:hypothetical protein
VLTGVQTIGQRDCREHEAIVRAQLQQRLGVAQILAVQRTHAREHVAHRVDDHAVQRMQARSLRVERCR